MKKVFLTVFKKNPNETESLNGLRALSIIGVIIQHIWLVVVLNKIPRYHIFDNLFMNFTVFVDLFFVLSGFLIYGGLSNFYKEHGFIDYKGFFVKRIFRIFPAYYFFLFIILFLGMMQIRLLNSKPNLNFTEMLVLQALKEASLKYDFLYLSNYFGGSVSHNWSLATEEQFYIFLPFFLGFFLLKTKQETRIKSLIIIYFLPLVFRMLHFLLASDTVSESNFIYRAAHTRMDSLFIGILVFEFHSVYRDKFEEIMRYRKYLYGSLIILFFPVFLITHADLPFFADTVKYSLANFFFGIVLLLCLDGQSVFSRAFSFSVFRPVARVSYTAYLWHISVGGAVLGPVSSSGNSFFWFRFSFQVISTVFITLCVGWLLFILVEYPFIRIREKYFSGKDLKSNSA
ncbi:MAG TPA: acyltransferase [Leptospiraceae bacterium]|nr:acyltransferase [Leptospiraceae bacterium]HNF14322.1 acyltransferase [Leptospiraceae bacterium]HNF25335.1 acyltransferase [Leptospiraceae bacterium]HNI26877.1 acyltransferase [Leptospiraceae bacterium]HNM04118.1 acyltransferase [Leptospiraceae bacterium]